MERQWWLSQNPITSAAEDLLDFADAAHLLADRLRDCYRPADLRPGLRSLVASFEAPSGAGKTSFSNLLLTELVPAGDPRAPIPVRFSPELSRATTLSLWTALAYRIGEAFYRHFHERARAAGEAGEVEAGSPLPGAPALVALPTEELTEQRLHWLEVAWRVSEAFPKEHWASCLKLFSDAPSKIPGRRLDWRSATDTLIGLAKGGLYTATGQAGDAIGEVGAAAEALIKRPQVEGPSWGVDTEEFVRDLERLLQVLHPGAAHWRAVIVLDDLGRLDGEEDEPELQEVLAYLRRLDGVLTLVNLDRDPIRRDAAAPRNGAGLDALIDLRMPIPSPGGSELLGFARLFVEELELPLAESEIAAFVRHLRERGVRGAREIKKALLWLWLRLHDRHNGTTLFQRVPHPGGRPIPPRERIGMLELLVDLHRFVDGQEPGVHAFETAERHLSLLAYFPVCPWNLQPWIDRGVATLGEWRTARDLVLHLRLLTLAQFVGAEDRTSGHRARARELWRRWRSEVVEADPLRLRSMDSSTPENLTSHLEVRLGQYGLVRLFATALLASAVRHFSGVTEPVAPTSLQAAWFDADLLARWLENPDEDRDVRRRAWVVLSLLHPHVAQQIRTPPVSDDWRPTDALLAQLETQREALKALLDGTPRNR